VQAVAATGTVIPFSQADQIEECVRGCLVKLDEINQARGIISPPGSVQRTYQEQLAASGHGQARSIIFPLFGTGQGGSEASLVVGPMLAAISGFLNDRDEEQFGNPLTDIYVSAYAEEDVQTVIGILESRLGPVSRP
jgi:hypothetical protein